MGCESGANPCMVVHSADACEVVHSVGFLLDFVEPRCVRGFCTASMRASLYLKYDPPKARSKRAPCYVRGVDETSHAAMQPARSEPRCVRVFELIEFKFHDALC